jgi:hypothetical protein
MAPLTASYLILLAGGLSVLSFPFATGYLGLIAFNVAAVSIVRLAALFLDQGFANTNFTWQYVKNTNWW